MTLPIVDEQTSARLTVTFLDYDDVQQAPASATYQIHTQAGVELRAATAITPAGAVELFLNDDDNAIDDDTLQFERHVVTVKAVYSASDLLNSKFEYKVRNLLQVT
jgi:hypothetical protein